MEAQIRFSWESVGFDVRGDSWTRKLAVRPVFWRSEGLAHQCFFAVYYAEPREKEGIKSFILIPVSQRANSCAKSLTENNREFSGNFYLQLMFDLSNFQQWC